MSDQQELRKPADAELNDEDLEQVAGGERVWPDDSETETIFANSSFPVHFA